MYDLHSHILPGIDDGAKDVNVSLEMARAYADQGIQCVACTPHILPGLYHNSGPQIRQAVVDLQVEIDNAGIALRLTTGADNHVIQGFVQGLEQGHLLSIADSRYVLVEPPHHVAPPQIENLFFNVQTAGYVPILTHPERLTWIENKYEIMQRLAARGVWMQITSGSLNGSFGRRPRYWAQRMLAEGLVHILATDAHNMTHRPPDLMSGFLLAEKLLGRDEAQNLVVTRPHGVLTNSEQGDLPVPQGVSEGHGFQNSDNSGANDDTGRSGGFGQRLRRLFRI